MSRYDHYLSRVRVHRISSPGLDKLKSGLLPHVSNSVQMRNNTSRVVHSNEAYVFADESPPVADPHGLPGWHFTNSTMGSKINWYIQPLQFSLDGNAKRPDSLDSLNGIALVLNNKLTSSSPFVQVYTKRKNDGNDAALWYRSRITYTLKAGDTLPVGACVLHVGAGQSYFMNRWCQAPKFELEKSSITTMGPQEDDEEILSIALSTATGSAQGAESFTLARSHVSSGDFDETCQFHFSS